MQIDTQMEVLCEHSMDGRTCDRQCKHKLIVNGLNEIYRCGYHWREIVRRNDTSHHYVLDKNDEWKMNVHEAKPAKGKQPDVYVKEFSQPNTVIMFNAPIYIQTKA